MIEIINKISLMLRRIVKILPSSFSYSTSKAYDVSHLSVKDLEVQA